MILTSKQPLRRVPCDRATPCGWEHWEKKGSVRRYVFGVRIPEAVYQKLRVRHVC